MSTSFCQANTTSQTFLTLITALIHSQHQFSSPKLYPTPASPVNNSEYDYIVIGAGSAGSVLTSYLSKNAKVLLIEAGGYPPLDSEIPIQFYANQFTENDWQYQTQQSDKACLGIEKKQCYWPRGKMLGGTSSLNAMIYIRGNERDYDQWQSVFNLDSIWNWKSVEKLFKQLENMPNSKHYGNNGLLNLTQYDSQHPIAKSLKQSSGLKYHQHEVPIGIFESPQNIYKGRRMNAAKAFLGAIPRDNLTLLLRAECDRVLFTQNKANAVQVSINNKEFVFRARKEIVLSAGAINTPKLLLLSGLGPANHLKQMSIEPKVHLSQVGQHLEDHLVFFGLFLTISKKAILAAPPLDELLYQYFKYGAGELGTIAITNLIAFINTKNSTAEYPNIQFHYMIFRRNEIGMLPVLNGIKLAAPFTQKLLETNKKHAILGIFPTLLNPKSAGFLKLKSNEPRDKPLIYANYLQSAEDLETMSEGIEFALKQLKKPEMAQWHPELIRIDYGQCKKNDSLSCFIPYFSSTLYHPVGTSRMGTNAENSVVDSHLRVHGVEGLRVADASVMPKIVSGNTNAASMMIGLQAAKLILN